MCWHGETRYDRVNEACEDDLANPRVGGKCDNALQDMLTSMGDFTTLHDNWNVYEIYDTCSDMPHRRLGAATNPRNATSFAVVDTSDGHEQPPHTADHGSTRAFIGVQCEKETS